MADETRNATVRLSADIDPYTRSMSAASVSTEKTGVSVDGLMAKMSKLQKVAGQKLMLFGGGMAAGLTAVTAQAAAYEKSLSTLQGTSAITSKSMTGFEKEIGKLSKTLPIARGQAVELVTTLDTLGVSSTKQIGSIADSMVRLSAASGESLGGLTTGMVELGRQMGTLSSGNMSTFANSLLTVSKNAGVSAQGVLQFASAIAPASRAAGLTEQQVLGVSTAFAKAGADGFAAGNTFNKILNDITRQIVTGSPEIAKYANLIGITSSAFAKMDKGEALTQIFEEINRQGPDAIKTLDRLGFDGVRDLRSIQAVSQAGGLRASIADATNAPPGNLQTASDAAMSGMGDKLTNTTNAMAALTTLAGTPLVEALTPIVGAFNDLLNVIITMGEALAPLVSQLSKLGTVLAAGAIVFGGALLMNRILSMISMASAIGRSTFVGAARDGLAVGRGNVQGRTVVNTSSALAAAGGLRAWQRVPYLTAMGVGQALGANAPSSRSVMGSAIRGVGGVATGLIGAQTRFYADSRISGWDRQTPLLGGMARAASLTGNAIRRPISFVRGLGTNTSAVTAPVMSAREAGAARAVAMAGRRGVAAPAWAVDALAKAAANATAALGAAGAAQAKVTATTPAQVAAGRQLAATTGAVVKGLIKMEAQLLASGTAIAARAVGSSAKTIGTGALGLVGGPWGAALLGGIFGGMALKKGLDSNNESRASTGGTSSLDKYNVVLGIATNGLGSFTTALKTATENLPKATSIDALATISNEVVKLANSPDRPLVDENVKNYRNANSQASYLQSLDASNPDAMQLAQADLTQVYGRNQAQSAMDEFQRRGGQGSTTDFEPLFRTMSDRQGDGFKGAFRTMFGVNGEATKGLAAATMNDISGKSVVDEKNVNAGYAEAQKNNQMIAMLAASFTKNTLNPFANVEQDRRAQSELFRTFEDKALGGERLGFDARFFNEEMEKKLGKDKDDPAKQQAYIAQWLRDKDVDNRLGDSFGVSSQDRLSELSAARESATAIKLRATGPLGNVMADDKMIQTAIDQPGNVSAQYEGTMKLVGASKALGGTYAGADSELQKIKASIEDVTSAEYQLADAAQQYNAMLRSRDMPMMSRAQQTTEAVSQYRSVMAGDRNAPDFGPRKEQSEAGLTDAKMANYEYLKSIVTAHRDFGIQRLREERSNNLQLGRQDTAFKLQMTNSETDFNLSRTRNQNAYTRSLQRAGKDQAKAIYDPMKIVYSEYTTDAGTLLQNLIDQNKRISDQTANLAKARKLGLSQDSIDTLNLADPAQSQALQRQIEDLQATPELVGKINNEVNKRLKETTKLTQNPASESFRRSQEDFKRGADESASDYAKSVQRIRDANKLGLSQMAEDRATALTYAKEDLARMGDEIFDKFPEMMERAATAIGTNLGVLGEKMSQSLAKIKEDYPEFFLTGQELAAASLPGVGEEAVRKVGQSKIGAISKSDLRNMNTVPSVPSFRGGMSSTSTIDASNRFEGAITVQAQDPAELARKLAGAARIKKLTRPGRGGM